MCNPTATKLTAGSYTVTAVYLGSTNFLTSTSAPATLVVSPAATSLTLMPVTVPTSGTHTITLKATLKSQVTSLGIGGQKVTFAFGGGGPTCTATTGTRASPPAP